MKLKQILSKLIHSLWPLIFLGIVSVSLLGLSELRWQDYMQTTMPLLDNISQARISATKAQLMLDRILAGDGSIRIEDVWPVFDRAELSVKDSLAGRSNITKLRGKLLIDQRILELLNQLEIDLQHIREVAAERWVDQKTGPQAYTIKERSALYAFERSSESLEYLLINNINSTMSRQKIIRITSIAVLAITLLVGLVTIYTSGRKRIEAEDAMRTLNEELENKVELRTSELSIELSTRKQAEEELKKTLNELAISNAELEQFAYIASHDLREPLRSISAFTDLLSKRYKGKLDKDADEFIRFILEGTGRMDSLINDLLAYSSVISGKLNIETVDSRKILTRVIANLSVDIEKANAIITSDELPVVSVNPMQMEQVLQNLISNGIKFQGEAPPIVHTSAAINDDEWVFSVKDNGIGINAEHQAKIFDMFQRLHGKSTYEGTGIGLAICKKVVELHGGKIWIESEEGKGCTFYFTIPCAG